MNETIVTIQGAGTFIIPTDKVSELVNWLQNNKAIGVNEGTNKGGEQLLNG